MNAELIIKLGYSCRSEELLKTKEIKVEYIEEQLTIGSEPDLCISLKSVFEQISKEGLKAAIVKAK